MDGRRVVGVLIGLAVLTGCSAAETGSNTLSANSAGSGQGASGGAPKPAQEQQQQQINQPGVDRKLIRTANLELEAPDVVDVTNKAREIATDLGGFAGKEDVRGDSATLTLHIPSTQFDKALEQLSKIVPNGVKARNQTAEDVTEQLVDVESRIATQRTSVQRVRELLAKAQTVNEIVQIESEVTRREADLESLEKRRESLAGQVALSTVTVKVGKGIPAPPAEEDRSSFLAGLIGGWDAFITTGSGLLRVLGAVLPFLIVLGPLGYVGWRWWRRRPRPLAPAVQQQELAS
jgi:TolA-binding protein